MIRIRSEKHFQQLLEKDGSHWLMVVKSDAEKSACALLNAEKAAEGLSSLNLYVLDVTKVTDIHAGLGVTTAPSLVQFEGKLLKNIIKGCQTMEYYKGVFNQSLFVARREDGEKPVKRVTVYSTPTCSWCNTLKGYLRQHSIYFRDIDVSKDQGAAEEMVRRSGQRGVPQTDINGEIIVGFNKSRINELLNIQ